MADSLLQENDGKPAFKMKNILHNQARRTKMGKLAKNRSEKTNCQEGTGKKQKNIFV